MAAKEEGLDLSESGQEQHFVRQLMDQMYECDQCGCLTLNQDRHTKWHVEQQEINNKGETAYERTEPDF